MERPSSNNRPLSNQRHTLRSPLARYHSRLCPRQLTAARNLQTQPRHLLQKPQTAPPGPPLQTKSKNMGPSSSPVARHDPDAFLYLKALRRATAGNQLALTRKGYVGPVPEYKAVGEVVCVFGGAHVLFAVRVDVGDALFSRAEI